MTDRIPASSPGLSAISSTFIPCASAQRTYIRASIAAQSQLSVPPAPALTSRKVSLPSASPSSSASISRCAAWSAQAADRRLGIGHHRRVALGLAELDQLALVRELARQPLVALQRIREPLPVAHQLLRPRRIVPELGVLRHGVELFQPVRRGVVAEPLAQQRERLLDLLDQPFGFSSHDDYPGNQDRGRVLAAERAS